MGCVSPMPPLPSPPLPTRVPRTRHQGRQLLVFGGHDGQQHLHDLYLLDTKTFIWTEIELPGGHPLGRTGSAFAMMGPSRAYMMGGYCKVCVHPGCYGAEG